MFLRENLKGKNDTKTRFQYVFEITITLLPVMVVYIMEKIEKREV